MIRSPQPSSSSPSTAPFAPQTPVSRGRTALVHFSLVAFALAIVGRAAQLQLFERARWRTKAQGQQVKTSDIAPPRGRILDATGAVLAESREMVALRVNPQILRPNKAFRNPRRQLQTGLRALNMPPAQIRRALDTTHKWVVLPGMYVPTDIDRFVGMPGVFRERTLRRAISAPRGIRNVMGELDAENTPKGGIEQELDTLLRGVGGRDVYVKDGRGHFLESPELQPVDPTPGHTVALTLNQSLQEIAERELLLAMARTGASGGDVVMLDPRDGAILALAGARDGKLATESTPLMQPYEPGSVMKPFLVSRLLDEGRAKPDEMINTEGGVWRLAKRPRPITDEHKASSMSVRDVIRLSSNIGVAKLSQRYTQREEYEAFRDFGFGVLTGVPYPAESRGRLPQPKFWDGSTRESMAMGYAMSATPLQIAVAYAAIANGGELLQPVLVKEIRDAGDNIVYQHKKRVVRRVLSPETARLMVTMLESVVDSGTAMAAEMKTFEVAGKSGTARRAVGRGYSGREYNSTFAGMFPAQAPQYVFVARLVDPKGKIFGGTVSGTMVNAILQAALATRDASLDRRALAAIAKPIPVTTPPPKALTPEQRLARLKDSLRDDSLRAPLPRPVDPIPEADRVTVSLPLTGARDTNVARGRRAAESSRRALRGGAADSLDGDTVRGASRSGERAVPSVYGLDLRQAVRTLYAAGFQVRLTKGTDGRTRPAPGTVLPSGATVVLESRQP